MTKPRLLDLYAGAAIGADGYAQAGFDLVCVDNKPQPENPYEFYQDDALAVLWSDWPKWFDAIHASPTCQAHTRAQHLRDAQGGKSRYEDTLTPTLELLRERWMHKPWVVENVPGAPMQPRDPEHLVLLCGSMFGLGVRRHRLFLSNVPFRSPGPCRHREQGRPWGVYHVPGDEIPKGGRTARDVAHGREVMGVTREVSWAGLKEGIPPAYTRWIGAQLLAQIGGP